MNHILKHEGRCAARISDRHLEIAVEYRRISRRWLEADVRRHRGNLRRFRRKVVRFYGIASSMVRRHGKPVADVERKYFLDVIEALDWKIHAAGLEIAVAGTPPPEGLFED